MPKVKTNSSAKKRFSVTGSGKVKRFKANTSHRLTSKSRKAKLRNRDSGIVHAADMSLVKRMLWI